MEPKPNITSDNKWSSVFSKRQNYNNKHNDNDNDNDKYTRLIGQGQGQFRNYFSSQRNPFLQQNIPISDNILDDLPELDVKEIFADLSEK